MGRGRCVQVHSCFVCILIQNFGYKQWGGGIVRVQAKQQEKPQKFIGRRSRIGPHRDCHGRCFHTEGYTLKQLGYNLSMFLFCFMLFTFSSPSTDSLSFLLIYSCRWTALGLILTFNNIVISSSLVTGKWFHYSESGHTDSESLARLWG